MLCSLSISQWSASKHDRQASEEIAAHHGAQPDVGRYNKLLIPKGTLAEVHRIAGEARREHYFMTLPWDDNGYRVLPAAVYMEHTDKLREYSRQFMAAVEVFATQFDQLVIESRSRLAGLFRAEDYPTSKEIHDKFAFETKVMPLPDANDFRVGLGDEEKDRIKRQITASVEASLTIASRELWLRMYEAVSHMALTPEFSFPGSLGNEMRGREAFQNYVRTVRAALADYHCEILSCVAEGNQAFAKMCFSRRHVAAFQGYEPTGKLVQWLGVALFRFEDSMIAELWVLGDLAGLDTLLRRQAAGRTGR